MHPHKLFMSVVGIALLFLMLLGIWSGVAIAESRTYEPPHPRGHTPASLIVGVPFEDAGSIENAGVIDLILGVPDLGLIKEENVYFSQTNDAGKPEMGDLYGIAVAAGDFDRNGVYDIAIGVPGEDGWMGAVNVIYRYANGGTVQTIDLAKDITADASAGDEFGSSLVAGDFNGDGYDDLAVGAPGYHNQDGAVFVMYGGGEGGLYRDNASRFLGSDGERFGEALAKADFDANGVYDLVVGAPEANTATYIMPIRSGRIQILYGPLDMPFVRMVEWTQSGTGQGISETGDEFGAALIAGDFNGDGGDDLAIGAPGEDNVVDDRGAVNVLYNDGSDLSTRGAQVWLVGEDEGDWSGFALAAGDFNCDGADDLAIGSPYHDYSGTRLMEDAGEVDILFGSQTRGLTDNGWLSFGAVNARYNKYLGYALLAGDFNGDECMDLIMGIPGFSSDGHTSDGAIEIRYGTSSGDFLAPVLLTQNELAHVAAEDGDDFGYTLAALPPSHPPVYFQFTPFLY